MPSGVARTIGPTWNQKMTIALKPLCGRLGGAVGALLLSACATVGPTSTPAVKGGAVTAPSLGLFSRIRVPSDREPVLQLSAQGVQIFRCEKREGGFVWVFRQPDAQLFDNSGKVVGRHGASFSFEHNDGSRLTATIAAYDDATKSTDLRWLLLTTRSFGKGAFEGVTHVQRVNTKGGIPPDRCDASQLNSLLRVDFTADFVYYGPKPGTAG
jgi:hypothetical protein